MARSSAPINSSNCGTREERLAGEKKEGRELVRGMTARGRGVDTRHGPEKIRACAR